MNILLAIKPDYAAAILAGTKTVELRSYLPRNLHPGDTIYLVGKGRMWGHCTYAGATPAPPPGPCRDMWLESIAAPAAMPTTAAHFLAQTPGRHTYAWHLRYPVTYGENGAPWHGGKISGFSYTAAEPGTKHPRLENYLLYLRTHKTP